MKTNMKKEKVNEERRGINGGKIIFDFPKSQGNIVVLINNQEFPVWKMRGSGAIGKDMSCMIMVMELQRMELQNKCNEKCYELLT